MDGSSQKVTFQICANQEQRRPSRTCLLKRRNRRTTGRSLSRFCRLCGIPDMTVHTSPTLELTRHFFREFFYLGLLTDSGADSFIRLVISMLAGVLSLGILLPLLFFQKYLALATLNDPKHYQRAILGDQLFMLCVAMFIVASVGTAICQSMFPSEIDFRILTPLPVTRRAVFGAKLLALAIFTAVFVLVTNIATGPVFPAVSEGRWAQEPLLTRMTAHTAAGLLASTFALASVLSLQGFIAVLV